MRGLRWFRIVLPALAVAALAGCGPTSSTSSLSTTASGAPSSTAPWMISATGSPTPSPTPSAYIATPTPTGSLWTTFPSSTPCPITWPSWADDQVLIPMIVTPGKNSIKVQWPSRYGSTYRVMAVNQVLVTGAQPVPTWNTVTTSGTGCTVTTTLTGLISNNPYIVWLDAPNTSRKVDGSRDLYSGKSGVVRPL